MCKLKMHIPKEVLVKINYGVLDFMIFFGVAYEK